MTSVVACTPPGLTAGCGCGAPLVAGMPACAGCMQIIQAALDATIADNNQIQTALTKPSGRYAPVPQPAHRRTNPLL